MDLDNLNKVVIGAAAIGLALFAASMALTIDGLPFSVGTDSTRAGRLACVALGCALWLFAGSKLNVQRTERIMTLGGIVVLGAIFGALIMTSDQPPKVPDVTGFNEQNAVTFLETIDIELRDSAHVASDAPRDSVISQDREPGSRSHDIVLQVSAGRPTPVLPDVVDESFETARQRLQQLQIRIDDIQLVRGGVANQVVAMTPDPGTESSRVQLTVADGSPVPSMPDLVGKTDIVAAAYLDAAGIEAVFEQVESSQPIGEVVDQTPAPDDEVSRAIVSVSAGPGLPVIPDVVNATEQAARETLAALSIEVSVETAAADEIPEGVVMAQDKAAGERSGSLVLTVSSGPAADSFDGAWKNVDGNTAGISRLVIRESGTTIEGFGACAGSECEWGEVQASFDGTFLTARYDFGFATTAVKAQLAGPLMLVEATTAYADGDARLDRTENYTLSKTTAIEISVAQLDTLTNAGLAEELVTAGAFEFIPQLSLTDIGGMDE